MGRILSLNENNSPCFHFDDEIDGGQGVLVEGYFFLTDRTTYRSVLHRHVRMIKMEQPYAFNVNLRKCFLRISNAMMETLSRTIQSSPPTVTSCLSTPFSEARE